MYRVYSSADNASYARRYLVLTGEAGIEGWDITIDEKRATSLTSNQADAWATIINGVVEHIPEHKELVTFEQIVHLWNKGELPNVKAGSVARSKTGPEILEYIKAK